MTRLLIKEVSKAELSCKVLIIVTRHNTDILTQQIGFERLSGGKESPVSVASLGFFFNMKREEEEKQQEWFYSCCELDR